MERRQEEQRIVHFFCDQLLQHYVALDVKHAVVHDFSLDACKDVLHEHLRLWTSWKTSTTKNTIRFCLKTCQTHWPDLLSSFDIDANIGDVLKSIPHKRGRKKKSDICNIVAGFLQNYLKSKKLLPSI